MSNEKKPLSSKLEIIAFLAKNPHIVSEAIQLLGRASDIISEAQALIGKVKKTEKSSLLSGLIKSKKQDVSDVNNDSTIQRTSASLDNGIFSCQYDNDNHHIVASLIVPKETLSQFTQLDIDEDMLVDPNKTKLIGTNDFDYKEGRFVEIRQYQANIAETRYLGNKTLVLQSTSSLTEENGDVYIKFDMKLFNYKTKDVLVECNKKIKYNNKQLPEHISHYVSVTKDSDLVMHFEFK